MRDFKGMKRQRGRNRGGGNAGGAKPQQQNANRAFDSNGPDGAKVRGNAQHVFEKYQQLARDASSGGDRVLAENYLQHAEHYFRVVRAMQPTRPASDILGRDSITSGFDIDFEDESGAQAAAAADAAAAAADQDNENNEGGEGEAQPQRAERWQERPRDDRQRDERPRDDRPRNDRFDGQGQQGQQGQGQQNQNRGRDRWRERDDRPRTDGQQRDDRQPRADDRPRDDRPRDERPRDERPRDERPREDRAAQDDRPRRERFDRDRDRGERQDRDPLAVVEPKASPLVAVREELASPVLRDDDGGESQAPAFLKAPRAPRAPKAVVEEVAGEEKPKARRRRAPRSFEGGEGTTSNETEEA